jgi:hypothetical protein
MAAAQYSPYGNGRGTSSGLNGPTVSPYLNLFQINSQGLIPYQSLVRPQIEQQDALNRQAGAIQQLQQQVNTPSGGGGGGGRQTGHTTYFMNYSHFYRAPGSAQRR